jgi:thioredoxin-related protein
MLITPVLSHAALPALADNLAAASAEATGARQPIMLFFTQPGCVFCERARRQYIRPLASTPDWNSRTRSIEVSRAQKLRGFDGLESTGAEIARRYGVRVYPTVVFVDSGGVVLAAPVEGFTVPDFYGAYLEERLQQAAAALKAGGSAAPPNREAPR